MAYVLQMCQCIIICTPINMRPKYVYICLCDCVLLHMHICVHFIFAAVQALSPVMHHSGGREAGWASQSGHINCINELTNSDVFHVFYYFSFAECIYVGNEMLMMWHCWKFSARYKFVCACVCMDALKQNTVGVCDKRIKQKLYIGQRKCAIRIYACLSLCVNLLHLLFQI